MAIIEVYDNPVLASAIADARHNATIVDSFVKANSVINNPKYNSNSRDEDYEQKEKEENFDLESLFNIIDNINDIRNTQKSIFMKV